MAKDDQLEELLDWAELEGSKGRHPSSRRRADLTVPPVDGD